MNFCPSSLCRRHVWLAFSLLLGVAAADSPRAEEVSPWQNDLYSATRLLAGPALPDGERRAGIEVKLAPGWKTYWRYPGDSGIPPRFDFSGSTNVQSATVAFPAPKRFQDGTGFSIGYETGVIFPIRVVPQDRAKPVQLRMQVDYAVCRNLCVPAAGRGEIALPPTGVATDAALSAAEASVPKAAQVGAAAPLTVRSVRREDATPHPRVIVDVAAPSDTKVDLFAEGPAADWALPLPEPIADAPPGLRRFAFELDGLPPGTKPDGAALRLTVVSHPHAIEVVTRLD